MKTIILTLLPFFLLNGCDNNKQDDYNPQLPPITQTGANTFGCIINEQVFYPRDGMGNFGGGKPGKGLIFWGSPDGPPLYSWEEIDCGNFKDGKPASKMIIHLQSLSKNGVGEYIWHSTNYLHNIDGLMQNYVYAKIFNATRNTWVYYGSFENSGKTTITRYDIANFIVSGTFSGRLRLKNGTQEIEIQNGRFDINLSNLDATAFP